MTLFNPILSGQQSTRFKANSVKTALIKCLDLLYTERSTEQYAPCVHQLINIGMFDRYMDRAESKFKEIGVAACLAVIATLFEFGASRPKGASRSFIRRAVKSSARTESIPDHTGTQAPAASTNELTIHEYEKSTNAIAHACKITFGIFSVGLRRSQDKNVLPLIHTFLSFIKAVSNRADVMRHLESDIPWSLIAGFLNVHATLSTMTPMALQKQFPKPSNDTIGRPFPEDFVMRGQIYMEGHFPTTWFTDAAVDNEERVLELPSMAAPRLERIL